MEVSRHWSSWLLPKRLRTIMIVTVVVAVLMGILIPLRPAIARNASSVAGTIVYLLVVSPIGAIVIALPVLVQMYLYPKKQGLWYAWKTRSQRPARSGVQFPAHVRYPRSPETALLRSQWQRVLSQRTPRTRLFEGVRSTDAVSRAALMLTVGARLEAAGKKEAARTCYEQIIDRFANTLEAHEAAARIEALAPPVPANHF
jgi:hypothetical protein